MAECVVTLHSVTSRNIHPCVSATHSYKLRNAPGALVYNPLGSTRWNSRLLSAKINARPQDLLSNGRKSSSTTWVASTDNSSQEPIQLPAGAEEGNDNISAEKSPVSPIEFASTLASAVGSDASSETELPTKKKRNRKGERKFYLLAAIASSIGFTTLSAGAVYYRFYWQLQGASEVPYSEILGTFSLAIGAAVGMEYWARWAHKALWHDSLWNMHESHHRPREGPFEMNDIFAIINAVPAISLMAYGFFHKGLVPGLCFGAVISVYMVRDALFVTAPW